MKRFANQPLNFHQQQGFSLLEALFSALILAIALFALAGFHVGAFKDSSLVKSRMVATNLAHEKLDDLRSYTVLRDDVTTTAVNECAVGIACFSEILTDAGGKEASSGSLVLPSGTIAAATGVQDSFTRKWDVKCASSETSNVALSFGTTCTSTDVAKLVTVKITWKDSQGTNQEMALQSVIYSMDPANGANVALGPVSGAGPKVKHTPYGVIEPSTATNSENTKFKESSRLDPEISATTNGAVVSFDTVSYTSDGSGGYDITKREEFTTAPCECSFAGSGQGYTPSRMIWNGTTLKAKVGAEVTKTIGTAANGQSDFCTACCKDHHDVSGTTHAKYDPSRPSAEYTSGGDHKHYWYTQCGTGTDGETSGCNGANKNPANGYREVTTGAYLESCRFKRVDGYWRLWQDWRQVKMTILHETFLSSTSNQAAYTTMNHQAVENAIRVDSGNLTKTIEPLPSRDFTLNTGTKQLFGRGLYVDRIYKEDAPTTLDADYYSHLVSLIDANKNWLDLVSFSDGNLTLVADWTSAASGVAEVSSEVIKNITDIDSATGYYNTYSRGAVTAVSAGTTAITVTSRMHNSGITGGINLTSPSYGISAYDNTGPLSDTVNVTVGGSSSTTVSISGTFIVANYSVDLSSLPIQITGATCNFETATAGSRAFNCTASKNTNVTLDFSSTSTGYGFSPDSLALGVVNINQNVGDIGVYGPTLKISGTVTGNKLVTATGLGLTCTVPQAGNSYSCTANRGTTGYTGTLTFGSPGNVTPASYTFTGQQSDIPGKNVVIN